MPRLGLIILAAGQSSRMGRPKQLLTWNGRTLLRHACETALATTCHPVIVVLGCEAEACAREIGDLDVVKIVNPGWSVGMGQSISVGVLALETRVPDIEGVVLMLVDQPGVTSNLLDLLVAHWASSGGAIAATKYPEGEGVPAVFGREFFPSLRALNFDEGARGLIAQERSRVAVIDPGEELVDLDTPESLAGME